MTYYCTTNLPDLSLGVSCYKPDPNMWNSIDISDFSPWSGKKLLVPRRYQIWHSAYQGYSISQALFMESLL
jgi:hypothetical protein